MAQATKKLPDPADPDQRPLNRRGKGLDHTPGVSPAQKKASAEENRRRAMANRYAEFPATPGAQMRWVFRRSKSEDVLPEEVTLRKLLHRNMGEYLETMARLEAQEAKVAAAGPAGDRPPPDRVSAQLLELIDKTIAEAADEPGV